MVTFGSKKSRKAFRLKSSHYNLYHNINMFWTNLSGNRVVLIGHRRATTIWSLLARKSHGKIFAQKAPIIIYTQYKHVWDKFERKKKVVLSGHRRVTPIWSLLARKSHGKLFAQKAPIIIYTQYKNILDKFEGKHSSFDWA